MPRLKVVHTFHFGNYPHTRPRILWMERVFSRLATGCSRSATCSAASSRPCTDFDDRRIEHDLERRGAADRRAGDPAFRERVRRERSPDLVGTIATYIEQKGLRDLMRVAQAVRDAGPSAKFVVVGEGRLRPELEALRHQLGLDDMVTLTGWVTNAAGRALPAFDVFFQPSLWEAMSVVTLEAMAAASRSSPRASARTPHIIEHGVDGLLVDPKDVERHGGGARPRCSRTRPPAAAAGSAPRRRSSERFTVDHMTRAYEADLPGRAR